MKLLTRRASGGRPVEAGRGLRAGGACPGLPRSGERGVVIPTAMFLVLILFALVTAIQLTVNQNFQVTRVGHERTRAIYMAKAAAHRALAALNDIVLNDGGKFEREHTGEANRKSYDAADPEAIVAWCEPGNQADLLLVVGRAQPSRGVVARHTLTVIRRPPSEPIFFARPQVAAHDAGVIWWTKGERTADKIEKSETWEQLPAVPNDLSDLEGNHVVLSQGQEGWHSEFACAILAPTADCMGNVYVVRRTYGGADDRIVRYNFESGKWTVFPRLPEVYYRSNGTLVHVPQGQFAPPYPMRIHQLASDGAYRIFACQPNGGLDSIFMLDQSEKEPKWVTLPPVREQLFTMTGKSLPSTGHFAKTLVDLCADSQGNLFVRQARPYADTVYRYNVNSKDAGTSDAWTTVQPPPRMYWTRDYRKQDGMRLVKVDSDSASNLSSLSVGEFDELYGLYDRDGYTTIYRWDRRSQKWDIMPPAPRLWWQDAEKYQVGGDEDELARLRLHRTGVDAHGTFYVRWNRDGIDSIFQYDPKRRRYRLLPPVPRKRLTREGYVVDESWKRGNDRVFPFIPDIFAGGRPSRAYGGGRYVLMGSF